MPPANDNDNDALLVSEIPARALAWAIGLSVVMWAALIALVRWFLMWLVEVTR